MNKLTKNIITQLKQENIKPKPKILFLLEWIIKVIFFLLTIFVTSIIGLNILEFVILAYWDSIVPNYVINTIFQLIPMYLIILVLISTFISSFIFRKINNFYKLTFVRTYILNNILFLIIWLILYLTNTYTYIYNYIEYSYWYKSPIERNIKLWTDSKWYHIWKVIKSNEWSIIIKDYNWNRILVKLEKDTLIRSDLIDKELNIIKIKWKFISNNTISAEVIYPEKINTFNKYFQ